jgi:hypothetical protein
MRVIDAVGARLHQSVRMADKLGIDLPAENLASESTIRRAIWRCIFCRHGTECADWLSAGAPGVPDFCGNREFYLGRAREAG